MYLFNFKKIQTFNSPLVKGILILLKKKTVLTISYRDTANFSLNLFVSFAIINEVIYMYPETVGESKI